MKRIGQREQVKIKLLNPEKRQKYDFSGRLAVVAFNYNYYTVTVNYTQLQMIKFVLATLYKLVHSFQISLFSNGG